MTRIILFFSVRTWDNDKNSGRPEGFGFVHPSTEHEASCAKAKAVMDGKVKIYLACSSVGFVKETHCTYKQINRCGGEVPN